MSLNTMRALLILCRAELTVSLAKYIILDVYKRQGEVSAALDAALEALEAKEIEFTATNGNIEWQQAPYGQKQVINICNHGNSSVEVTLNVGPMYDACLLYTSRGRRL